MTNWEIFQKGGFSHDQCVCVCVSVPHDIDNSLPVRDFFSVKLMEWKFRENGENRRTMNNTSVK